MNTEVTWHRATAVLLAGITIAMGAWRISRTGVLTRRMPAVESIGAATVLAVDKTGTLTENRMRVALAETLHHSSDLRRFGTSLHEDAARVLGTALAASERDAFDPMERAIHEAAGRWVPAHNIYARTKPEHKLRLVQAFKANGEVIAMTGDGVDDAPALKAAHVGVAMGGRGTDVAREAAALVLVNDDFASLVTAVRLGRRIYSNIRHAMSYIVAVHIPIAGLGLLPVVLGWPLLLFPMHVLFLEFVIDPACAFVFEADQEATDVMQRKPRRPEGPPSR